MIGRDPTESHRASTPLELLVDLTFAASISLCADSLNSGLSAGHIAASLEAYPIDFFAIWWAWMNFTWFASAYDTDDIPYRIATFCQMTGVLVVAAGIPRAFEHGDFAVVTVGYVVMRIGLVSQWLRAARDDVAHRPTALRYALGLIALEAGWIGLLWVPSPLAEWCFFVLVVIELLVPLWAERAGATSWHPRHIAERYGLLTLIVLGESVLSATVGLQNALDAGKPLRDIVPVLAGGLLIIFTLWWLYFDQETEKAAEEAREEGKEAARRAFVWGYGHYLVFASAAATGAGLAIAIDRTARHTRLSAPVAAATVTVPVAIYSVVVWALHMRQQPAGFHRVKPLIAAVLIVAATWAPQPILVTGLVLTAAVVARSLTLGRPSGN